MKTNTLMPLGVRGVLIAGATVAIFASLVMLAYADVAPTVTATIDNGSNTAISSAPIGTPVHASVTVASTSATTSPTGTVSFSRYDNTSCLGTATTQSGVSLTNGMASSSNFNVPATGLSYKVHYDGQSGIFSSADSSCVQVSATGSSTSLTTTLSSTSVSVGSSVSESATLAGAASNAGGSVSYVVYNDNSCSTALVGAGVRTVTNALVPNSDNVLFNNAGTYYWKAVYSGDASNNAASSSCLALSVSALATSTPTPTTTGMVVGTVYNDANTNLTKDSGENGIAGFTVHLRQGSGFGSAVFKTTTTDANGYYSFGNLNSGTYSIELVNMSPWHQDTGDYNSVALSSSTSLTENFAVHNPNNGTSTPTTTPSTISGEVYNDLNHNEKLNAGESGIAGFTINLYNSAGANSGKKMKTPFMTATTDANGMYSFANLPAGTYSVEEINKAGWHQDTGDYNKLVIKNGNSFPNTNFANTAASTSTNQGHGHDKDNGNGKDNGNKGGNGNHWGWQNFFDRFGSWPWGQNKNK
jgi:hypothetical protein